MMRLDGMERKLLNLVQTRFPLTPEPYADLGRRLGTDADGIIRGIEQLRRRGVIRLIGPVVDSRRLGYQSTLVAMRVESTTLEKAETVIARHPGVSHGYERDHHFNVWFTLAVPPDIDIESELERLIQLTGAEAAFSLPALRVFKIGAYFDMDEDGVGTPATQRRSILASPVALTDTEKSVINELQQDLPLTTAPFDLMAERAGMDTGRFLALCRSLRRKGVIRRFSASINHNQAGFAANALACWVASPDTIDIAGRKLASLKEVSHCYERRANPHWRYNLFAMIHGRSKDICQQIADTVAKETGLTDYVLLYSTREFKKTRVKYLV